MKLHHVFLCSTLAVGVVSGTALAQERTSVPRPTTYGTTLGSFYRVGSTEFTPIDTSVTYNDSGNVGSTLSRYVTSCATLCELLAVPHLPSGALVTGAELDACDTNGSGSHLALIAFTSSWDGTGGTNIGQTTTTNIGGCGAFFIDLTSANFTVDNNNNQLFFGAFFGALDNTNALSGVIVHYKLQVSPAPLTATFNDVPTSDFGFQFVEAFAAAGITVGCTSDPPFTPPVYCPDRNVTRREMAIFFAKALGLQFQ